MIDPIDFDPALVGLWPSASAGLAPYGSGVDPETDAAVREVWLETKAATEPSPAEALQSLLNDMTTEMRLQFEAFKRIRADAEAKLVSGDEGEQKIAKADIKSASDALSLIVRTLEKIDSLQRSLAHDRETAAEQAFSPESYDALLAAVRGRIDARAAELASQQRADAAGADNTGPPGAGAQSQSS